MSRFLTIGDVCNIKTGKLDSNQYIENGEYPFFTCAPTPLKINSYAFDDDVILIAGNNASGNFHLNRYKGKFNAYQRTYILTSREETSLDYIFYSLKLGLKNLKEKSQGSQTKFLTMPLLISIRLNNISLEKQQRIASVLSSLDDKIELNNRINAELEAMAKTLYDYWFVQFDFPDINGKPYKSSGGKMVYNKELKREIPIGWEVKSLFDSSSLQYGFPFSTDYFNEDKKGIPVIRIRDILENSITNHSTEKNIDEKYLLNVGDLLIGMDGNFHINHWFLRNCFLNQRVVRIRKKLLNTLIIKYQIEPFIRLREKSVSRTTVGHLSDKDLKAIKILCPQTDLLKLFNNKFDSILSVLMKNRTENLHLSSLRDWLLPMLMNGQVGFKEVYKQKEVSVSIAAEPEVVYKTLNKQTVSIPENKKGFAKQVLGGKIVSIFKEDPNFTHIKFQKLQFLAEHIGEADLNLNYYFQAAGPHDGKFMNTITDHFRRNKWYDEQNYKFIPLEKADKIDEYYRNYFAGVDNKLCCLFTLLKEATEDYCEIIATLYAVWNNRIILKQPLSDDLLIEDFYNWSNRKKKYSKGEVQSGLEWLRANQMEPNGFGKEIKRAKNK